MEVNDEDIFEFFRDVKSFYSDKESIQKKEIFIDESVLSKNECFYIFDLQTNEIVEYKGFDKLLGYTEYITLEFVYDKYAPNERDLLDRITKSVIEHCLTKPNSCENALLQLSFSIRKKDGTYIKAVSVSTPFKTNSEGYLTHFLVKITDVSFLEISEHISCFFSVKDLDKEAFRKKVYQAYDDLFTDREVEIIKEINNGLTNTEIADKLFISKHTVSTHRKNIFRKSNKSNVEELLLFCRQRGIIQ